MARHLPLATDSARSASSIVRLLTPLISVTACAASSPWLCAPSQARVLASEVAASGLAGATSTS